jgi:hypothetical protein
MYCDFLTTGGRHEKFVRIQIINIPSNLYGYRSRVYLQICSTYTDHQHTYKSVRIQIINIPINLYGYRLTHQQIFTDIDHKSNFKSVRIQLIYIRTNLYKYRCIHTYKCVRVQIPTNLYGNIINISACSHSFGAVLCAYTQMYTDINTNMQCQLVGTSAATLKTDRK